jgi:hypothetical protein
MTAVAAATEGRRVAELGHQVDGACSIEQMRVSPGQRNRRGQLDRGGPVFQAISGNWLSILGNHAKT